MRMRKTLFLLTLSALGCRENSTAEAKSEAVAAPKVAEVQAAPSSPPTLAQPEVSDEAFVVRAEAPKSAAAGVPFDFKVTLEARAGYKVNPEYPIKFTFDTGPSFTAEPAVLRKEQGAVEEKKAELRGPVRLAGPGPAIISGKLSFSVCTDARCLIEKRDVSVSVVGS